jgi:hypothetical protein
MSAESRGAVMKPQEPMPEGERQIPEWEIKLGKIIFYLTCALSIWFFYWFNGIQCPC